MGWSRWLVERIPLSATRLVTAALASVMGLACAAPQPSAGEPPQDAVGLRAPKARWMIEPGWVDVVAEVTAPRDEPRIRGIDRAVALARRTAVEFAIGAPVASEQLLYRELQNTGSGALLKALRSVPIDALILEEKHTIAGLRELTEGLLGVTRGIQTRLARRRPRYQAGMRLDIEIERDRLRPGEELAVALRTSHDARISLLLLTESGAQVVVPRTARDELRGIADEWLNLASAVGGEGLALPRASLPEGQTSAFGAIIVFARRGTALAESDSNGAAGSSGQTGPADAAKLLDAMLSPLLPLAPEDWAIASAVYEVTAD